MLILAVQEKTAIVAISLIIITCVCGTVLLDSIGKEQFATPYTQGLAENTLVSLSGTISKVTAITGGHFILEVSGVSIFIPASAGAIPIMTVGDRVSLIGSVQNYKGKEEIIVADNKDITILAGFPGKDQHSGSSASEYQD